MNDDPALYENREEKYSRIVHGEINALMYANEKVHGYTLYTVPFLTCDRCFVQMVQAGITKFIAPVLPEELKPRWEASLDKVRRYAKEMSGITMYEYSEKPIYF